MTEAQETQAEPRIERYGTGVIVRGPGGKFLPGTRSPAPITPQNTHEFQRIRVERKRERLAAGAASVVSGMGSVRDGRVFGSDPLDWLEAVGEQVTIKAMDPANPKQVDAARFLLQETGLSEARDAQPSAVQDTRSLLTGLLELVREVNGSLNDGYREQQAAPALGLGGLALDGELVTSDEAAQVDTAARTHAEGSADEAEADGRTE